MMEKCPICGGDRSQEMSPELRKLINLHRLIREDVNPGGRELIFETGGKIQLTDECNACDYKSLEDFLMSGGQDNDN